MNVRNLKFGTLALATALAFGTSTATAFAQTDGSAKQDMKSAGHETKDAAVDTGHGIKTGTKKGYRKTKHGIKKAYHKTANTLDPHKNSQDANHQ